MKTKMRRNPMQATYCGTPIETHCFIIGVFRMAMAVFWLLALTQALLGRPHILGAYVGHTLDCSRDDDQHVNSTPDVVLAYVAHASDDSPDVHHVISTPHVVVAYVDHTSDGSPDVHQLISTPDVVVTYIDHTLNDSLHHVISTPDVVAAYVDHTSDDSPEDHHVISTPDVNAAYVDHTSDDNRDDHQHLNSTPAVVAASVDHPSDDSCDDHQQLNSTPDVAYVAHTLDNSLDVHHVISSPDVVATLAAGHPSDNSPDVHHVIRTLCVYVSLMIGCVYFVASLIFAVLLIYGTHKRLSSYLQAFMWFNIFEIFLMILGATGSSILLVLAYKDTFVITAIILLFTVIYIMQLIVVLNTSAFFDIEKYYFQNNLFEVSEFYCDDKLDLIMIVTAM